MARKRWLEPLLDAEFVPRLAPLSDDDLTTAQDITADLREVWNGRGYTKVTQHKDLIRRSRKHLATVLPTDHVAFKAVQLSSDEYVEANRTNQLKTQKRNEDQMVLSSKYVNALTTIATQELISSDWRRVAAALALLTGRRHSELFLADFEAATDYTLWVTNLSKRRDDDPSAPLRIEIPTLCQAQYILTAIASLRDATRPQAMTEDYIGKKFGSPVADATRTLFGKYLAVADLSTHTLRDVYAEIATHFYCPANFSTHEFKAHVLGHYQATEAGKEYHRAIGANRNYDRFSIQDGGIILKGVRLSHPGVQGIQIFQGQRINKRNNATIAADLSVYPLVSLSQAYILALERGYTGSRDTFKSCGRRSPTKYAKLYGVVQDPSRTGKRPSTGRPTWRDLWALPSSIDAPQPILIQPEETPIAIPPMAIASVPSTTTTATPTSTPTSHSALQEASTMTAQLLDKVQELAMQNARLQVERDQAIAKFEQLEQFAQRGAPQHDPELLAQMERLRDENEALKQQNILLKQALSFQPEEAFSASPRATAFSPLTPSVPSQQAELADGAESSSSTDQAGSSNQILPIVDPTYRAIQAIFEWNNDPDRTFKQKWPISYPVLMELLRANGYPATQKQIKLWFDRLQNQIAEHYQLHGLSRTQSRYHQDKITDCISL